MCGIAGAVGLSADSDVSRMLKVMHHRGPDASGQRNFGNVTLGMTRLSVIDLNTGMQPVTEESGDIGVVFNGEIYNFLELRSRLISEGHRFKSSGDSEVIAHLYERDGLSFIHSLRGMFAIAIWDSRKQVIHLIRDRLGKKPLLYSFRNQVFLFASEAKALLRAGISSDPNFSSIIEVAQFGYISSPNTGFEEIKSVSPGSIVSFSNGQIRSTKYWSPDSSINSSLSEQESLEKLDEVVAESVKLRLVADRPIGSFLSGGIDSTIVTSYMAQLHPETVKTYTIGFEDGNYDESRFARPIAQALGTDHHELIVRPDPGAWFSEITQILDQPFADSSVIPTYLLAKLASADIVVALGGDGGDEAFGGYTRYRAVPQLQRINPLLTYLGPLTRTLGLHDSKVSNRNLRRLLGALDAHPSLLSRYTKIMSLIYRDELENLLPNMIHSRSAESTPIGLSWSKYSGIPNERKLNLVDLETYLPGDLLYKADIATMANSLELRSPLLDHKVIEFGLSLPDHMRIRGRDNKYLLRKLAKTRISPELIDRPKMGFAIPRASWLRGKLAPVARELLSSQRTFQRGWFDTAETTRVLQEHANGMDRDRIIWPMMLIEQWARNWVD
jgi:asparagine synthase (glutamine-hydrolysing)